MKIYLCASYSRRLELLDYRDELEDAGHRVVSSWVDGHHEVPGREVDGPEGFQATDQEIRGWALEDIGDLNSANCIIHFTGGLGRARGGRHTEFGMALAQGKRCIVVGPRENIFQYLHIIEHYEDWHSARGVLITERYAYPG